YFDSGTGSNRTLRPSYGGRGSRETSSSRLVRTKEPAFEIRPRRGSEGVRVHPRMPFPSFRNMRSASPESPGLHSSAAAQDNRDNRVNVALSKPKRTASTRTA